MTDTTIKDQIRSLAIGIGTDIAALRTAVAGVSGDLTSVIGTLVFDENTPQNQQTVATAIAQAKAGAIETAEGYTDTQIGTLTVDAGDDATVENAIAKAAGDASDALSTAIGTLTVEQGDTVDVQHAIAKAKADAITTSEGYTDGVVGTLTVDTGDEATVENAIAKCAADAATDLDNTIGTLTVASGDPETVEKAIAKCAADASSELSTTVGTLDVASGNAATVENAIAKAKSDMQTAINTAVTSAYIFKGTVANVAALPASGNTVGDVYNVTASDGNTPAGTNYAWNGTAWDALGGTLDATEVATLLYMSEDPLSVYNQAAGNNTSGGSGD